MKKNKDLIELKPTSISIVENLLEISGKLLEKDIIVIAAGGGACKALEKFYQDYQLDMGCYAVDSDEESLNSVKVNTHLQIGLKLVKGHSCGNNPEVGRKCLEENLEDVKAIISNSRAVILISCFGGGLGTGASPVIAKLTVELKKPIVSIIGFPFSFEGKRRFAYALEGVEKLRQANATIILIHHDKLFNIIDKRTTFREAFIMGNSMISLSILSFYHLLTNDLFDKEFLLNKNVLGRIGDSNCTFGLGYGDNFVNAVHRAINNPILSAIELEKYDTITMSIGSNENYKIDEVSYTNYIRNNINSTAELFFNYYQSEDLDEEIRISIFAGSK